MGFERVGWAFLKRSATTEEIAAALRRYRMTSAVPWVAGGDTVTCSVEGCVVRVSAVRRLRDVVAEVKAVNRELARIKGASIALLVDADAAGSHPDELLVASGHGGRARGTRHPLAVYACEALNIELAAHRPIVFDPLVGFYPEV